MRPFGLLAAMQFLTRVPIRLRSAPDLAGSVPWFPVAGALIGAIVGSGAAGLMEVVPPSVAAAVAVVVGVMITGAFHEDGLADTADAMGGSTPDRRREILKDSRHGSYGVAVVVGVMLTGAFHEDGLADTADAMGGSTPDRRREILKDSRHGSYGVSAMCSTIVVRIICVASLGPAAAFAGLVAAHTLGRGAAVAVMAIAPNDPTEGLSGEYTRMLSRSRAALGVTASIVLGSIAVGWWVVPLAAAVAIGALVVSLIAQRAFGGVSGDILGAVEQVGECLVLVVVSGLALHHAPWWA